MFYYSNSYYNSNCSTLDCIELADRPNVELELEVVVVAEPAELHTLPEVLADSIDAADMEKEDNHPVAHMLLADFDPNSYHSSYECIDTWAYWCNSLAMAVDVVVA